MPRTVLEEMMKKVVPVAERLLEQHGDFLPYGATLSPEGEIELIGGEADPDFSSQDELIEKILTGLKGGAERKEHQAVALVLNVKTTPPGLDRETDAIRAILEHDSGLNIEAFIPYTTREDGAVEYGEMFAFPGQARFFTE